MKKFLSMLLAIAIIFSSAYVGLSEVDFSGLFVIRAEATNEEYLTFVKSSNGTYYSLTGCNKVAEGEVVIPSKYNGLPVRKIDDQAFKGCSMITSVVIPDSVYEIWYEAFCDCTSLESVDMSNSVTYLGSAAFKNCTSLKSFIIPDSVTGTNYYLFDDCTSLETVTLGRGLKKIDSYFFSGCSSLKSIVIPNNITMIEEWAFSGCKGLTSIEIGANVKTIEAYAFSSCKNIKTVYIPANTSLIEPRAFFYCDGLISFSVVENNENYTSYEGVLFNKNKTILKQYPAKKADSSYTIPSSVASVEELAFRDCDNLTSIKIPDNVKIIEQRAFENCDNLKLVELSNNLSAISYDMFSDCISLESIVIPDSVKEIDSYAFENCVKLISCTIGSSVASINSKAFNGCTSLESIIFPISVTSIEDNCFLNCSAFKYIFYEGSEEEWNQIQIGKTNTNLKNAFIHYNSTDHTCEWVIVTEATCSQEGIKKYKCLYCDLEKEFEVISPLEHNYDYDNYGYVQNPENEDEYIKQSECIDCGVIGSAEEPYIAIRTIEDLYLINNNLSGNYILMADIDATEATSSTGGWSYDGYGWDPIGTNTDGFSGTFDGNGHSIIGLRITENVPNDAISNSKYYGLFAVNNGVIKNLKLVNANISGQYFYQKTVYGSSTTSTPDGFAYVGAVCGKNTGSVINCSVSGSLSTKSRYSWGKGNSSLSGQYFTYTKGVGSVGGIVGENLGTVSCCYNQATIKCSDSFKTGYYGSVEYYSSSLGGIVGCASDGSIVSECFNLGGFVGEHDYTDVTYGSGIVGKSKGNDIVKDCYAVAHNKGLGGSTILTSYYKLPDGKGGYYYDTSGSSYSLTDTQMKIASVYSGFDFNNIWIIDATTAYKYPQLRNVRQTTEVMPGTIELTTLPKTEYFVDDVISAEGGVLSVVYLDGTTDTVALTDDMLSTVDMSTTGTKTVDVTYKGVTTSFDVTVINNYAKKLTIESLPDNTTYIEGQEIDTTGLVVKAEFADGTVEYITDYEIAYDNSVTGEQTVTIRCDEATATFTVTFTKKTLLSIAVTKMPDKTVYVEGENFDKTGMVVEATYDNGLSEEVTDFTVSALHKTPGTRPLIVTYSGKRVTIQVEVIEKKADSMTVVEPEKFEYVLGDPFDPTGMVVTVTFNNGSVEEVTDYTIEGFGDFFGVGYVTLRYDELTYDLIILMHSPTDSWIIETQATCTENGVKHLYCKECGEIAKTETILATGHSYGDYVYDYVANTQTKKCTICGHTVTEEITEGTHTPSDWIFGANATCTEDGYRYKECTKCFEVLETETIPALGHSESNWITDVEPDCENPGSKHVECTRCGEELYAQQIPETGHIESVWVITEPATCEEDGKKVLQCVECGESLETVTLLATGHTYGEGIYTAPTCYKNGSWVYPCVNAGCSHEKTESISSLFHDVSDGEVIKEPTCTETGEKKYVCLREGCPYTFTITLPMTSHNYDYSSAETVVEATCEAEGLKKYTCKDCGCVEEKVTNPLGHYYLTTFTIDKEATCTEDGSKSRHCTRCDSKKDVTVIEATGHKYNNRVYDFEGNTKTDICIICGDSQTSPLELTDLFRFVLSADGTYYSVRAYNTAIAGDIVIPSTYKGLPVTTVLDKGFVGCDLVTSIVIPDSITTLEYSSFRGMESLASVSIGKGIKELGKQAFAEDPSLTTIEIPYGVEIIGDEAFAGSCGLVSVSIPETVTTIGEGAFLECSGLKSIELPDSLTSIGLGAFGFCTGLETIVIPEGVTSLSDYCLNSCTNLKTVVIKSKLTSIGEACFEGSYNLDYIFYAGSQAEWNEINIGAENGMLDNVVVHYNSTDHTYDWEIVPATCTKYGTKTYKCKYCDLQNGFDVIPATGHSYGDWIIDKELTCESDGEKHRICGTCGDTEVLKEAATGHSYGQWIISTPATCESDGERYHQCSSCGDRVTETIKALGHDYSIEYTIDREATCKTEGEKSRHCSRCESRTDITILETTDHFYSDWTVTVKAGCETEGERVRTCYGCGGKITEALAPLGHAFSILWTTDRMASCTVDGSKSHHCNRCDAKKDVTPIPATGHSFGEWVAIEIANCTTSGLNYRMCNVCQSEEVEEIAPLGHSYGEWTVVSTADCEKDGFRHTTCTVCGNKHSETIKAYGHDYASVFTVDKEATCTEDGLKSRHCSRCEGVTDSTVIAPLGHHISTMWTIDTEPTCESEGSKSHHCLRCDDKSHITAISVANHIYGKWEVVTPATMNTAGVRAHKCYNCEMTEEAELPKLLKYTATFVADGEIVATVDFPEDATEIEIPEVPHKDKFNGEWENFDVRNKNFTVNAVYTPIPVEEIDGITAGNKADYYSSTGEVEINLNVSAPGKTIVTTTTRTVPLDIVFVLDQSGSMADGGRKTALKNAVNSFSNAILQDAIANSVDHRIAVVGFASGNNNNLNYENTELLTSGVVRYDKISDNDYKNALVSVNNNGELNGIITDAVRAIDSEGATRADLGFEMASSIFAKNPAENGRQRVVVFLTDGVPTDYNAFETGVANAAIQKAHQIKNTYDATVYSVGVFDRATSSNRNVNNFMNYVSSNYTEEKLINRYSNETAENTNGYYLDVSDVDNLSEVFSSIVEETTTHTSRFTNATLKYTLTKYFTLTSVQEAAIRKNAIEALGVTNEQISIVRNADGTTTIVIKGVEPWASGENYVIDFTFRATANGNTLKSGTYQVGTFESGVILENGEGYEAVFAPDSVDIGGTSGIAVFNINGIPYAINRLSSATKVVAPATSFGADYNFIGWSIPANLTLNNEVRVFEAELLRNEYKIYWNIDGEIVEEKYAVGDFITVPQVGNNSIGGAFIGWDREIPETMPNENLTITAMYDAHYHKYHTTKDFETCTEGGTLTYTCDCGHTYTEEIEPCEHSWEVITASSNQNAIENAGSRCTVCGIKDSKALRLEGKDFHQEEDASYNTATYELDYVDENGDKHQPDGEIEISVQLDEVFESDIPENADANVYRVNEDGSRTKLESEQNGMNMTFTTDHFSTYEFEFTTDEQRYLFAQKGSEIDYENKLIFSEKYLAREFKSLVTYLLPAALTPRAEDNGYFATGSSIDVENEGATDSYTVIVKGDLNGDGVCDVMDASEAYLYSADFKEPTENEIYAANGHVADEIDIISYQQVVNRVVAG